MIINCLYCGKEKKTYPSRIKIGKGKYCDKKCYAKAQVGKVISEETKGKMRENMLGNTRGFQIGHIPWHEGTKGIMKAWNKEIPMTEKMKRLMSEQSKGKHYSPGNEFQKNDARITGENNYGWKGDNAGYDAIHGWIRKRLGMPKECVYCGKTREEGRIEWASISHKAKRDSDDYISLCARCHRIYDDNGNKAWITRRKNLANLQE